MSQGILAIEIKNRLNRQRTGHDAGEYIGVYSKDQISAPAGRLFLQPSQ